MALRAARNAGFFVRQTIAQARVYVQNLQNDDGGFRYVTADGKVLAPHWCRRRGVGEFGS